MRPAAAGAVVVHRPRCTQALREGKEALGQFFGVARRSETFTPLADSMDGGGPTSRSGTAAISAGNAPAGRVNQQRQPDVLGVWGPAVLSTGLRRALAAHGLAGRRVHQLGPRPRAAGGGAPRRTVRGWFCFWCGEGPGGFCAGGPKLMARRHGGRGRRWRLLRHQDGVDDVDVGVGGLDVAAHH